LLQQRKVLDTVRVHCQQAGLCVIVGEPGTGKSAIKRALYQHVSRLTLTVNEDIKNRVTYSVLVQKMAPASLSDFVRAELDKVGLARSTFNDDALALIVRSSEGVLRRLKNSCLGALLEAARDRIKVVDLRQVNRVLLQPHWRRETELPP
jgi:type II secretory pathway predicted ATPase ExeA